MSDFPLPAKRDVRRSFERAAPTYDGAALLQREVCERIFQRLDYIKIDPRRILDIGCGTGYGAAKLMERYARASVTGIDLAHAMLSLSARRNAPRSLLRRLSLQASRYHGVCADAEALPVTSASCELFFSSLTLQWCDPQRFFTEAWRVLAPGGLLMFSTFGPDTLKELRAAFANIDARPHVNPFLDMHDVGDLLLGAGFADPVMDMEIITLTYADLKAMLSELKSIGAHNVMPGRRAGLMGRDAWQRLVARYEAYRKDARLPATFEVVYGHAWKLAAAKRNRDDGRQVIDFHPAQKAGR
jgi:malonyl-CoA O-methyltransferase